MSRSELRKAVDSDVSAVWAEVVAAWTQACEEYVD